MGLIDDIKAALKAETPEPAPTPTPAPENPEPKAETPDPKPDPEPTPEVFTKSEVEEMLKKQAEETAAAMKEIINEFKGDGTPPVGGPAEPTETASDFSAWNAEIESINKRNN